MQIISYLYWNKPGEKEELTALVTAEPSEMICRKKIAQKFDVSLVEAAQILKVFKEKFIKK